MSNEMRIPRGSNQNYRLPEAWKEVDGFSKVITNEEAARNDYNLSPSRYVATNEKGEYLPIDEALVEPERIEEERKETDEELNEAMRKMDYDL